MLAVIVTLRPERPALSGPIHRIAGYTERWGSTVFGDYVTACGLTLPRTVTHATSGDPLWLSPTTGVRCGDCFSMEVPS